MDFKLPHLGEGADSGTVVNLFVKEGDQLTKDQPVLELENEKAIATIPSTVEGVVQKLYVKPGDKLSVGQSILSVQAKGGPKPATTEPAAPSATNKPRAAGPEPKEKNEDQVPEEAPSGEEAQPQAQPGIAPA